MTEHSLTEDYRALYRRAFEEFGAMALWNMHAVESPNIQHALVVARALRQGGNLHARRLAEQIEAACRAAH